MEKKLRRQFFILKNKILAVFLSIMMLFTFSVPVYALDTNITVQEETSYIQKMLDKLEQIFEFDK